MLKKVVFSRIGVDRGFLFWFCIMLIGVVNFIFCGLEMGVFELELIEVFLVEVDLNYDWWLEFLILCCCWEFGDLCLFDFEFNFSNLGWRFFVFCFKLVFKVIVDVIILI